MKKFLAIILALIAVLSLCSCGATVVEEDYEVENAEEEVIEDAEEVSEETSKTTEATEAEEAAEIDPDTLYKDKSAVCDQYTAYASGHSEGQDYAKLRFGPSKSDYNVVSSVDNGTAVTVQSKSVNGWTMVYAESINKEGWMRTDFLYSSYDECFDVTTTKAITTETTTTEEAASSSSSSHDEIAELLEMDKVSVPNTWSDCNDTYVIYVNDEYAGDPVRMRRGPGRDYHLIQKVNDGTTCTVWGYNSDESWACVQLDNGTNGWVLNKYVHADSVGDKPVLYLYPEEETDVDVKVNLKNMQFSCTYPEYNNGWSVTAQPDGTLINKADGNEYSYLYWELKGSQNYDFSKGFVVKGSDTAEFLRSTLSKMGLTPREYNEFIVYWLPKMQDNAYNLISFQTTAYTDNCQLDISPKPDNMLRVFMAYKALDKAISIEPQTFSTFNRSGFVAVEWGGAEVK